MIYEIVYVIYMLLLLLFIIDDSLLFLVCGNMSEQLFLNVSLCDSLAHNHIQLEGLSVNITNINTALMIEQNCIGLAVRVDAYICFLGLFGINVTCVSWKKQTNSSAK